VDSIRGSPETPQTPFRGSMILGTRMKESHLPLTDVNRIYHFELFPQWVDLQAYDLSATLIELSCAGIALRDGAWCEAHH
jgi:hypothetical protein